MYELLESSSDKEPARTVSKLLLLFTISALNIVLVYTISNLIMITIITIIVMIC